MEIAVLKVILSILVFSGASVSRVLAEEHTFWDLTAAAPTTIEGPFSYNRDGVPLIGWVVENLSNGYATLQLCNSERKKVLVSYLARTERQCPTGGKTGPFPIVVGPGGKLFAQEANTTQLTGITIDSLPGQYRAALGAAQTGETVGVLYRAPDGKLTAGITLPGGLGIDAK